MRIILKWILRTSFACVCAGVGRDGIHLVLDRERWRGFCERGDEPVAQEAGDVLTRLATVSFLIRSLRLGDEFIED